MKTKKFRVHFQDIPRYWIDVYAKTQALAKHKASKQYAMRLKSALSNMVLKIEESEEHELYLP